MDSPAGAGESAAHSVLHRGKGAGHAQVVLKAVRPLRSSRGMRHDAGMKLHLLRYFIVLAEELHFGRAAARLSITQPPLSSALKALEGELGVQLLERNSKHVALTAAGAAFLKEARLVLERVTMAGDTARAVAGGMRGRRQR